MTVISGTAKNLQISLKDLPAKKLFITIKDSLNNDIFFDIIKKHGSIPQAQPKLNVSMSSLYKWKKTKQYPLQYLLRIIDDLDYSPDILEKNLVTLRSGFNLNSNGGGLSKPIYPEFPIKISKELVRIIAHIFGDGTLTVTEDNQINLTYYNQNKILRESFKRDTIKVFGNISFGEGVNKTTPFVRLPAPIALILLTKIKNFNSKSARIPTFIKNSPESIKKEFIGALFDDEAYVYYKPPQRYIGIGLNNRSFLKDLKSLLNTLGVNGTKIYHRTVREFDFYYFYIRHYHNLKEFNKKVGFLHQTKKNKLIKILKNPGRKAYSSEEVQKKIIYLINNGKRTSKEISIALNRKIVTVNYWLNKLEKKKKVKKSGFRKIGARNRELIWKV